MAPDMGPKSFGSFEKRAPVPHWPPGHWPHSNDWLNKLSARAESFMRLRFDPETPHFVNVGMSRDKILISIALVPLIGE